MHRTGTEILGACCEIYTKHINMNLMFLKQCMFLRSTY